jgi:hypothetical protein
VAQAEAPPWTVAALVRGGYRQQMTPAQGARSVFKFHNETVNIWCGL